MRTTRRTLLAILPTVIAARAADNTPPPSDDLIHDLVRQQLVSDVTVQGGAIVVEVKDGAVTLNGKVRTDKARKKAEKLTKKVKGVKSVTNKLEISTTAQD
jgi:osmotically-inducible protein OsmY